MRGDLAIVSIMTVAWFAFGFLSASLRNAYVRRKFPMLIGTELPVEIGMIVFVVMTGPAGLLATLLSGQYAWPPTLAVRRPQ